VLCKLAAQASNLECLRGQNPAGLPIPPAAIRARPRDRTALADHTKGAGTQYGGHGVLGRSRTCNIQHLGLASLPGWSTRTSEPLTRIERVTCRLRGDRSCRLSYKGIGPVPPSMATSAGRESRPGRLVARYAEGAGAPSGTALGGRYGGSYRNRALAGDPGFEPGLACPSPGPEPGVLPITPVAIECGRRESNPHLYEV
jgi:hypothetical protein